MIDRETLQIIVLLVTFMLLVVLQGKPKKCRHCGAETPVERDYCKKCGRYLP